MTRLIAALVSAAAVFAGPVAAADAAGDAMTLEIAGVELTPFSFNLGSPEPGRPSPDRFQVGAGGALRLAKLRWPTIYWTVVQAGLFLGGERLEETIFVHIETEAGVTIRTGIHAFELGLGVGAGLLVVHYDQCNDSRCSLGGGGLLVSPVVRYLLRQAAPCAVALVARAEVFAVNSLSACGDACTGRATLFLVGVDIGFGWAPAPPPAPASLLHAD